MNAPSGWLGIGALSQKTRCKVETIRYYENCRPPPEVRGAIGSTAMITSSA